MTSTVPPRVGGLIESDSDSDDGKPIMQRMATYTSNGGAVNKPNGMSRPNGEIPVSRATPAVQTQNESSSDEDDVPLIKRMSSQPASTSSRPYSKSVTTGGGLLDDAVELVAKPLNHRPSSTSAMATSSTGKFALKQKSNAYVVANGNRKKSAVDSSSDSEDDKPLAFRKPVSVGGGGGKGIVFIKHRLYVLIVLIEQYMLVLIANEMTKQKVRLLQTTDFGVLVLFVSVFYVFFS